MGTLVEIQTSDGCSLTSLPIQESNDWQGFLDAMSGGSGISPLNATWHETLRHHPDNWPNAP